MLLVHTESDVGNDIIDLGFSYHSLTHAFRAWVDVPKQWQTKNLIKNLKTPGTKKKNFKK